MGTRCLTVVYDGDGINKPVVNMYRQYDGYPDGHGQELKDFLGGKKIINGISMGEDKAKCFNGMGCLAASLVAHFKTEIGHFYLYPVEARDCGEEYIYEIFKSRAQKICVRVTEVHFQDRNKFIYDGEIDLWEPSKQEASK